jgi:hypothetical protein
MSVAIGDYTCTGAEKPLAHYFLLALPRFRSSGVRVGMVPDPIAARNVSILEQTGPFPGR